MVSSATELVTGDGRTITVGEVAKIYRENLNVATPSSGKLKQIDRNNFTATCVFNTLDCDTLETIKTYRVYSLGIDDNPEPEDIDSVQMLTDQQFADLTTVTSENSRFLARLRSPTTNGGEANKKQLLEIWDQSKHVKTIDLSDLEAHGSIVSIPKFSNFEWCPFKRQDKLLYICESKEPKNVNFFKSEKPDPASSQPVERGLEFEHREDWGESFSGISHTIVGIIDVSNDCQITTIDMKGFSLADSRWMDKGNKIVSVAYPEEPRRLGLVYCNNRPSRIVVHDLTQSPPKQIIELVDEEKCFHTPRVDHSGQKFVYLTNLVYGPHFHSNHLCLYNIEKKEKLLLVDNLDFGGHSRDIFVEDLPSNCFSMNDKLVLFQSADEFYSGTYIFYIDEMSSVDALPSLEIAVVEDNIPEDCVDLVHLMVPHMIIACKKIPDVEYEMRGHDNDCTSVYAWPNLSQPSGPRNPSEPTRKRSKQSQDSNSQIHKLPTIVMVHGGPHSSFNTHYMPTLVFFARLGFKALLINYRGSRGDSEDSLQSLCGKIGEMDVKDCLSVIKYYVDEAKIDQKKLIIYGGSHGGFLSCHLSCQDEFKFTSAIIRNPVVNIPTMYETTDIPDWVSTEALNHRHFDFKWTPNEQDLLKMHKCSPDHSKARVPTLMLLGSKDQRVKMSQGMRWVELLKARGIETKCKVYPDKHDLGRPEVQADSQIESAIWMMRHLVTSDVKLENASSA